MIELVIKIPEKIYNALTHTELMQTLLLMKCGKQSQMAQHF